MLPGCYSRPPNRNTFEEMKKRSNGKKKNSLHFTAFYRVILCAALANWIQSKQQQKRKITVTTKLCLNSFKMRTKHFHFNIPQHDIYNCCFFLFHFQQMKCVVCPELLIEYYFFLEVNRLVEHWCVNQNRLVKRKISE